MLPTKPTPTCLKPDRLWIMLYGRPKIGKTTWAASFPDALFACTEDGHKHLSILRVSIDEWRETKEPYTDDLGVLHLAWDSFCQLVAGEEGRRYKTLVIDTVDRLYALCMEWFLRTHGHPSDMKYGKGWELLGQEFRSAILPLRRLQKGIIFISHTTTKYVSVGTIDVEKKELSLPAKGQQCIVPECDTIMRADYTLDPEDDTVQYRTLIVEGSANTEGGSRLELPPAIPLVRTGGYAEFCKYIAKTATVPTHISKAKLHPVIAEKKQQTNIKLNK